MGNLTQSLISRKNVLNNDYAIFEIQKQLKIEGMLYDDEVIFTKQQLASYFDVDTRTIERYMDSNKEELEDSGYRVLRGKALQSLKKQLEMTYGTDINVGTSTSILGIFSFRAFLNMAMIISESEKAKEIRSVILNIVLDVINEKAGGSTKYINQRDEDFLNSWFSEEDYRKEFTNSLDNYVDMGNVKYAIYTNKIYKDIFKEHAQEYRQILKLKNNDRIRDTMYAEVLDLIASYEVGLAYELKIGYESKGKKLTSREVDVIFKKFHDHPSRRPLLNKARNKMASRDLAFRDALHLQLEKYITPLGKEDYERFLGEKSKELQERLEEAEDVFKRLKEY